MSALNKLTTFYGLEQTRPGTLQRLLLLVGVLSIATIISLSAWGFHRVFKGYVITNAETHATDLSKLMLELVSGDIIAVQDGRQYVQVSPESIQHLDRELQSFLRHFDVVKIKLYDTSKHIAYSSDKSIIGKLDQHNRRLEDALAGTVNSKLVNKSVIRDLDEEQHFNAEVVETYVPIVGDSGKVIGSFEIYIHVTKYYKSVRSGVFWATSILTIVLFVVFAISHLVIAYGIRQLKSAHALLARIAITDALTGLANRGYLVQRGTEEFERSRRKQIEGEPQDTLGCIMLDIDHFKLINDQYGHLAGDQVLKEFAERLAGCKRKYDLIGRYGGEEFALLLPDTSVDETFKVAERVLEQIKAKTFPVGDRSITLTASAGVAGSCKLDTGLDDLLKRADNGLYQAKESGRDKVVCVPASPGSTSAPRTDYQ